MSFSLPVGKDDFFNIVKIDPTTDNVSSHLKSRPATEKLENKSDNEKTRFHIILLWSCAVSGHDRAVSQQLTIILGILRNPLLFEYF